MSFSAQGDPNYAKPRPTVPVQAGGQTPALGQLQKRNGFLHPQELFHPSSPSSRAQPSPACPGSGRAQPAIPHCYTLPPKGPARAFPLAADRQRRRRHPHSPTPHGARTAQEGESASTDLPAGLNSRRKRNPLICPRRCATGSGLDSGAGFLPDTIGERTERTREGLWRGVVAMVA